MFFTLNSGWISAKGYDLMITLRFFFCVFQLVAQYISLGIFGMTNATMLGQIRHQHFNMFGTYLLVPEFQGLRVMFPTPGMPEFVETFNQS